MMKTRMNSQISKSVNGKNAYRLFTEHCEGNNLNHEDMLKNCGGHRNIMELL